MILVFYWQINALMFLALQHSTYAAILDLVARAMFLEAAVLLLSLFISEISPSNTRGKLRLVYCHCSCILWNKIRIFEEEILSYCAVVFQSGGCLPPSPPWLLRSDIKQCSGGLNFIWTCQHIHKGTRLDSSHKHLCHRIKAITTVF